eukprot:5075689-Amphidinium_carterae.1
MMVQVRARYDMVETSQLHLQISHRTYWGDGVLHVGCLAAGPHNAVSHCLWQLHCCGTTVDSTHNKRSVGLDVAA